ncbi:hypothetical protein Tco_0773415 [Tanacetum coccineum]|uniref:Uncharacterized protein n=1 Tax=Tanacetum coccineum TaxID=301880 RepID=A0ABQ4ZKU1_9ASTR
MTTYVGKLNQEKVLELQDGVVDSPGQDGRLSNGHNLEDKEITALCWASSNGTVKYMAYKQFWQELAASEFSHLNHSLSHRPVFVKLDISKASSAGGKLHILKPSCKRNGITPTLKESLSPTSGSKVPNSPLTGKNEESYKFPIVVQQSFNSLWSQDVRGDPDSGIGGHWRSSDSGMYKFILILRALAVFRFRRALAVFRFRHAFTKNGIACIYLEAHMVEPHELHARALGSIPCTSII